MSSTGQAFSHSCTLYSFFILFYLGKIPATTTEAGKSGKMAVVAAAALAAAMAKKKKAAAKRRAIKLKNKNKKTSALVIGRPPPEVQWVFCAQYSLLSQFFVALA